ncbi:MAG: ATP synthase subunit I [Rhodoferax sp.]|nr:ATP synthase subunit I [Rhodoferax sp.]
MNKAPYDDLDAKEIEASTFKRLTRQEAQALRELQPPISPWRVIRLQAVVGLGVTLLAWVFTMKSAVAWSAAYGAMAVVIPAMLFARGLMSQFSSINAMTAGFGFFVWEAVKIGVSVAMLFAAPKLIAELNWLAMLIGLVVTMKVYWVALLMRPKLKQMNKS